MPSTIVLNDDNCGMEKQLLLSNEENHHDENYDNPVMFDKNKSNEEKLEYIGKAKSSSFKDGKYTFDEIIDKVGSFGRFQIIVIFLFGVPIVTVGPMAIFSQIFTTHTPDHWCHTPFLNKFNLTENLIKNLTIPKANGKFESCRMYDINFTEYIIDNPHSHFEANTSWPTSNCKFGWDYDKSVFTSTIVTEWNLVCKKKFSATIANTFYNTAMLVGGTIFGTLSDKIGRKKLLFGCLAVMIASGVGAAFSPNLYLWITLRMIVASAMTLYWAVFMTGLEMVGRKQRGLVSLIYTLAVSLGVFLIGAIAYFIRDWRTLSCSIILPYIIFFLSIKFYPESPRWLMTNEKMDQLQHLLNRMAKYNGKASVSVHDLKDTSIDKNKKNISLLSLLKVKNVRRNILILTYIGFINHILYFGLTFFIPALAEDIFLASVLSGLAEMPGFIFGYLLMDKIGRRRTVVITFLMAGLLCSIAVNVQILNHTGSIALILLSKAMVTANQIPIIPYSSEVLPTGVRTLGVAVIMNIGSIGVIFVPVILFYGSQFLRIPFSVFGACSIISAFVGFFLPETMNTNLTDTVLDADQLGVEKPT